MSYKEKILELMREEYYPEHIIDHISNKLELYPEYELALFYGIFKHYGVPKRHI